METVYSFEEVKNHTVKSDCWIIISGKTSQEWCEILSRKILRVPWRNPRVANLVHIHNTFANYHNKFSNILEIKDVYDVTAFLEEHPGGEEVLVNATGKDATVDFEDVGHSYVALELMKKYCIGTIDTSSLPIKQRYEPPPLPQNVTLPAKESSGGFINILLVLIPLLILGLALFYQKYGKQD